MVHEELLDKAFKEDMPSGDVTTDSLNLGIRHGYARLFAKEDLVLSGSDLFEEAVLYLEPKADLNWKFQPGDWVLKGQTICVVQGNLLQILKAERVGLNFLGRFCGIATLTRCFSKKVEHTKCKILDTRKTTPTFRHLERKAVVDGQGTNHRLNLSDAILVKENHIRVAGGMTKAIERIRLSCQRPIEVEVTNLEEFKEAVKNNVDRIMLDNMSNEDTNKALKLCPPSIQTEASGNMSLDRVASVAELGVNFISVGAITHSAPSADLSLIFDWNS